MIDFHCVLYDDTKTTIIIKVRTRIVILSKKKNAVHNT